jgi:hypothetical protein
MHCEEWRDHLVELWGEGLTPEMERHASECAECRRQLRDQRLIVAGFRSLRLEPVPEPSLGFSERLTRRLAEVGSRSGVSDFFELVGRRFVYATLALTFLALLALVLPSAGPVRGVSADLLMPSQEITQARLDPLSESSLTEVSEEAPSGAADVPEGEK